MITEPGRQSDGSNAAKEFLEPSADSSKIELWAEKAGSSVDDEGNCHMAEEKNTINELETAEETSMCAFDDKKAANNTGKLSRQEIGLLSLVHPETETTHSSIYACASVSTGSQLEVCDVSSTEAEEATEEKGTTRRSVPSVSSASIEYIRLCFRLRSH